jgi:ribonuclease D
VGFDTESKPTFQKGEVSRGPHVVQFSTARRAYIFMLHLEKNREVASALINSPALKKVGFGLGDDLKRIPIKLGARPKSVLDLETLFSARGYGRGVGVKVGVAIMFKQRFMKSKKASTSNWMNRSLTDSQILYAANDAYAAIKVYEALEPKSLKQPV